MLAVSDPPPKRRSSPAEEVRRAIAAVRDPEIDETVESLDFIVDVTVEGGVAEVTLRLPTFWCPANFVFMMADDMRDAVTALPGIREFRLRLVDHFAEDEINRGINEGLSFEEVFPGQAGDRLADLRRSFDVKTFLMRQEALLRFLRGKGLDDDLLAAATLGDIGGLAGDEGGELAALWHAYLQKREAIGLATDAAGRVAVDGEGNAVSDLAAHLRAIRRITTNAGANGEMCRMLVAARRETAACGLGSSAHGFHNGEKGSR